MLLVWTWIVPVGHGQVPQRSERTANYTMEVRLDPATKIVHGREILNWRNTSTDSLSELYFHLYLNAFKNNRSTYFLEGGSPFGDQRELRDDEWGYCRVDRIAVMADGYYDETDLASTLVYVQPDDDNDEDQTVFKVTLPKSLPPGSAVQLEIGFTSKLPLNFDRTGFKGDFFFVAQWFPKIGVYREGGWNCHQFHANSEFFADFGVYDVKMTVPRGFVLGATGRRLSAAAAGDQVTYQYYQEDIHDFAWTASPSFVEFERRFTHPELPAVEVRLLLQPEHTSQAERHFQALFQALKYFGEWYGEYPYATLTVVDPAFGSSAGGMEYPTLITAGTRIWAPRSVHAPEGVVIHEFGHQYWYGLLASNEFEEAWLDEGLNTYATAKVLAHAYPRDHYVRRFFGVFPYVHRELQFARHARDRALFHVHGRSDTMARRSWQYDGSYGFNSYSKPAVVLFTLENLLGEELMTHILKTYSLRFRFGHPTTEDFIATVNEISGRDLTEFFQQTFFSSEILDYAVGSIENREESDRKGIFDGTTPPRQERGAETNQLGYRSEVLVRRLGGVRLPVTVRVRFEDGSEAMELWDGQYNWTRFVYRTRSRVVEAGVDPERQYALDVNFSNNTLLAEPRRSWGAWKWAARWLFWFQHFLEVVAGIS